MNSFFFKNTLTTLGLFFFGTMLQASVVFDDRFDSGTGAWYKAYTNANTTLTNDSGRLSFAAGAAVGGVEVIGRSFATQTLGVGEILTLAFDFRPTAATGILRFGLYDLSQGALSADDWARAASGTYAGYTTFIRDNGTNVARRELENFTTDFGNGYPTYGLSGRRHHLIRRWHQFHLPK